MTSRASQRTSTFHRSNVSTEDKLGLISTNCCAIHIPNYVGLGSISSYIVEESFIMAGAESNIHHRSN